MTWPNTIASSHGILAGLGKSKAANNGDQSLEKMAHDLETVRQATCADTPVILVGHSIGGMIQHVTVACCRTSNQRRTGHRDGAYDLYKSRPDQHRRSLTRAIQPFSWHSLPHHSTCTVGVALELAELSQRLDSYDQSIDQFLGKQTENSWIVELDLQREHGLPWSRAGNIAMVSLDAEAPFDNCRYPFNTIRDDDTIV